MPAILNLPPAAAHRWVPCPASPTMEANFEQPEPEKVTLEGRAAHWVLEHVLMSWLPVNNLEPVQAVEYLGRQHEETGLFITEEMIYGVTVFLETVWADAYEHLDGLKVEWQCALPTASGPIKGRVDVKWESPDRSVLRVYEFKFGFSYIEVYENWQLLIYACGAASKHTRDIYLVVVQPRGPKSGEPVRTWPLKVEELRGWFKWITNSATLARGPNPLAHAGPWCRNCLAAGNCAALDKSVYRFMEYSEVAVLTDVSDKQLAVDLEMSYRAKKQIEGKILAGEAMAAHRIKIGRMIPGFAEKSRKGHRKWTKAPERMKQIAATFDRDIMVETKVLSPNQAQGRGLSRAVIDLYTYQPTLAPALEMTSPALAREAFFKKGDK